jgi:hypothetical protein
LEDFNALAMSLGAGMADVRGCLILSSDGLVLGAHPAEAERTTTPAWVRFAAIGDPERGFAQFGTETLCYVRRGPYAGFAVAGPGARPGLMIAHMEQVLLAAEESRWRHEWLRGTEAAPVAPRSEPSSSLQLEPPAPDPLVIDVPAPVVLRSTTDPSERVPPLRRPEPVPIDEPPGDDAQTAERPAERVADPLSELVSGNAIEPDADQFDDLAGDANGPAADPPLEPTPPVPLPDPVRWSHREPGADAEPQLEPVDEADEGSGAGPETGPGAGFEPADQAEEEDDDVDRFSLAREFGRLLQRGEGPADG